MFARVHPGHSLVIEPLNMSKKKVTQAAALCLVVLGVLFFFWQIHLVGDSAVNGVLLWNSEEAYLFVGWGRSGYHLTGFEYLLAYIPAFFRVPRTVDDNRFSTIVARITPSGVERYVTERNQKDSPFLAYFPRGNTIYAYDGGEALWKWVGTHFEKLSPEEQQKVDVDAKAPSSKEDYTNVNGWSLRHSPTGWPPEFEIQLQGKPVAFFTKSKHSGEELSIELRLPDGSSQGMLHVKHPLHFVSKSEYARAMKWRVAYTTP
jgi:hypothetical protein